LNVEPAVGSTPPSAGVTPAPGINRKMARTPFCSQVLLGEGGVGFKVQASNIALPLLLASF
jgi:hypothetical protein